MKWAGLFVAWAVVPSAAQPVLAHAHRAGNTAAYLSEISTETTNRGLLREYQWASYRSCQSGSYAPSRRRRSSTGSFVTIIPMST